MIVFVISSVGSDAYPASSGSQLLSVFLAILVVAILLAVFILPDYICWRRRLRDLPSVVAHQIQFVDESTARQALELILAQPKETQFDKFCEISRALTKSKKKRAGEDGLLFGGEFQIGSMPEEYEALERALFSYKNQPDTVVGPIQTHLDAYHLAYIVSRKDPKAAQLKEKVKAEKEKAQSKRTESTTKGDEKPRGVESNNNLERKSTRAKED